MALVFSCLVLWKGDDFDGILGKVKNVYEVICFSATIIMDQIKFFFKVQNKFCFFLKGVKDKSKKHK